MEKKYKPELNFLTEFDLSRKGIIKEVTTEFDIIKLTLRLIKEETITEEIINRIAIMPLRKMLCENKSLLLELEPHFKMPPLSCECIEADNGLIVKKNALNIKAQEMWLLLDDWLRQKIAYFDKTVENTPFAIPEKTYLNVKNRLGKEGSELDILTEKTSIDYDNEKIDCYIIKRPKSKDDVEKVFDMLKKAGYYDLTLYDFIKHLSDKRAAHIDYNISPLVKIINHKNSLGYTPILIIALQMIYATQLQIPEFKNYWPELNRAFE